MVIVMDIPLSPYAQKVKLALLEKGVAFETRVADVDNPDPQFSAASPRLEVPALLDGEVSVFDSTIILQYIEERWPEPALLPATPAERARVRTLEEICDTLYDAATWGVAEVLVFKRAEGPAAQALLDTARTQIAGLNARLERELQARTWFNGDALGYGDIAVYPFVNGAAALGYKPEPAGKLNEWLKRMRLRPSAERLKQDVTATLAEFGRKPQLIAEGKAKREYRDHRLDWMMRSGGKDIVLRGMERHSIRFSLDLE